MKSKLMLSVLGACLALSFAFTGCATTGGTVDPARAERLAKGAVSIIVVAAVEDHPEKAAQVAAFAHQIRSVIGTDGFNTVDLLMAAVQAKLATANMKPAAQIGVALALGEIGDYLHGAVGTGVIPTDKLPLVLAVVGWVEDAANMVLPPVVVPPPTPVVP